MYKFLEKDKNEVIVS